MDHFHSERKIRRVIHQSMPVPNEILPRPMESLGCRLESNIHLLHWWVSLHRRLLEIPPFAIWNLPT